MNLASLPTATAQAVFDHVSAHLLAQRTRSAGPLGGGEVVCKYRGPGKLQCAAGCLMSDQEYDHRWEGLDWNTLVEHGLVPMAHLNLILELQRLHDSTDPANWPSALHLMAAGI